MPVVRKVQSKMTAKTSSPKEEVKDIVKAEKAPPSQASEERVAARAKKKVCQFHENKTEPRYWDASALRRFLNDRGRIYPRTRSGTCAKHQRALTREIKRARHLALLPFTAKI